MGKIYLIVMEPLAPDAYPEIRRFPFSEANIVVPKIHNEGKVPFVIDTTEDHKLNSYFKYKATICEVGKMDVQLSMKCGIHKSIDDISDEMRFRYVSSAKLGGTLIYDLGQAVPLKWKKMCSLKHQKFNQTIIFNTEKNRQREFFATIVKPEEDKDEFVGNQEAMPKEDFAVGVIIDVEDTERIPDVLKDAKAVFVDFENKFEVLICEMDK